jgi:hypothetical protein
VIVRTVALIARGAGDALDEQLETVSAQIAPGAFQVARDQFASGDSNIEDSPLDCVVWYFCYGQAIESTGAAKH